MQCPVVSNLQLQGVGDLNEYLIDSSAITSRIRASRWDCRIEHPIKTNNDPKMNKVIPTPVNGGNLDIPE